MASVREVNNLVVIGSIIVGILLFYFSVTATNHIGAKCDSNYIRNVWTAILTLSAVMFTASVSYAACMWSTDSCVGLDNPSESLGTTFYSFGLLISLVLVGLLISVISDINKKKYSEDCGKRKIYLSAVAVLVISIVCVIAFSVGVFYAREGFPSWLANEK